ncbi:MAG: hypothetical protein WCB12_05290 [Bryobacteraceae bacterium]
MRTDLSNELHSQSEPQPCGCSGLRKASPDAGILPTRRWTIGRPFLLPLARSLALAQVEEQDLTPDTTAALGRARASLVRGEGIRHDEILREFGLKQ